MTEMDASGLANIFLTLGNHWAAKWLALLLGLRAVWTVIAWRRCPQMRGEGAGMSFNGNERLWKLRFAAVMLLGIGLSVWGLLRLAREGAEAPLALIALVVGIYLFTTEPVRRTLADARKRVHDSVGAPTHANNLSMLRDTHVKLAGAEVSIFLLFALGMTVA
ncbi:hypothetical protein ACQ5SO_17435 [Rhodovulum sp. DZ06]|uniref:hypothetical protein n=1 Tax=Rhodovulum sp. DZ06 TaxID=3425126 RepID=UPI003D34BA55